MRIREKLIHFQNQSEKAFRSHKSFKTAYNYVLALCTFLISNLIAVVAIPYTLLKKSNAPTLKTNKRNKLETLVQKDEIALLDFWASWCGPCIMMNPILESFSIENKQIKIIKINADTNADLMKRFKIKGIPQFILVQGDVELKRHVGPMTKSDLIAFCQVQH